jgi:hypothetical protein
MAGTFIECACRDLNVSRIPMVVRAAFGIYSVLRDCRALTIEAAAAVLLPGQNGKVPRRFQLLPQPVSDLKVTSREVYYCPYIVQTPRAKPVPNIRWSNLRKYPNLQVDSGYLRSFTSGKSNKYLSSPNPLDVAMKCSELRHG